MRWLILTTLISVLQAYFKKKKATMFQVTDETPNPEVLKLWGAPGRGLSWSSGGGGVDCMRDIFILNEIWVQGKMYFW
jgi:hypothetical protein